MQRSVIIKLFLNEFGGVETKTGSNERIILIFALRRRGKGIEKTKRLNDVPRLVRPKAIESRMLNRALKNTKERERETSQRRIDE